MTTFHGFGPGKKGGPRRLVLRDGELVPDVPKARVKKPAVHTRFVPFTTHQVTKEAAKRAGAHRQGSATHFTSEAQLNRYLAHEKAQGRHVFWKEHDQTSDETPT